MGKKSFQDWLAQHSVTSFNKIYIEELYNEYLKNPNSVNEQWAKRFAEIEAGKPNSECYVNTNTTPSHSIQNGQARFPASTLEPAVMRLIDTFRKYGHLIADIDPLKNWERNTSVSFSLIDFGLSAEDDVELLTPFLGKRKWNIGELYTQLKQRYCGTIAYQFNHMNDESKQAWFIKQIESPIPTLTKEEKIEILTRIIRSETIERTISNQFQGAKRFGSEGGEGFGTFFEQLIKMAADNNYHEVYLGMYHRGRINNLVNTWNYRSTDLYKFMRGEHDFDEKRFTGDILYHSGSDVRYKKVGAKVSNPDNVLLEQPETKTIDLHMTYNPSHLETGWAVCCGCVRAAQSHYNKIYQFDESEHRSDFAHSPGTNLVLPIMVHGDAGSCGQGMMYELTNMCRTRAYTIGGSIHITINNQIGFTTSNHHDARSSIYPTDFGKINDAPIMHVNGDDPEAIVHVASLAFKYRQRFKENVYVDLVAYRRMGHNEADDPTITQPQMYAEIKAHKLVSDYYGARLVAEGVIDSKFVANYRKQAYKEFIDDNYTIHFGNLECVGKLEHQANFPHKQEGYVYPDLDKEEVEVLQRPDIPSKQQLMEFAKTLAELPEDIKLVPTAQRLFAKRLETAINDNPVTWAEAELLAYASLLSLGRNVRISGEDVCRGTFAHRNAVVHNTLKEEEYIPMNKIAHKYGTSFQVWDSTLSENGPLAFEYGYSITAPETLDIWEAQFGDFANCGQVMVDNFISCMESRWNQRSSLTIFLPHGWEGVGAEHSSCRIERYLQLCSRGNMRVVHPTNAKQIYHLLMQQGTTKEHKPLVVAGPKSFLRAAETVTTFEDLSKGKWENLTYNVELFQNYANTCTKLLLTVGRLRYDVQHELEANNYFDGKVLQVNVEQLYPFPRKEIADLLNQLPNLEVVEWTQEEPENQGSWSFAYFELVKLLKHRLDRVAISLNSRKHSPVTSRCFDSLNNAEMQEILSRLSDKDRNPVF